MERICILVDAYHPQNVSTTSIESSLAKAVDVVCAALIGFGVPLSIMSTWFATSAPKINIQLTDFYTKGAELILSDINSNIPIAGKPIDMQKGYLKANRDALTKCYICGTGSSPVISSYVPQGATDNNTIAALNAIGGIKKVGIPGASGFLSVPVDVSDSGLDYLEFFKSLRTKLDSGEDLVVRYSTNNSTKLLNSLLGFVCYAQSSGAKFVQYRDF